MARTWSKVLGTGYLLGVIAIAAPGCGDSPAPAGGSGEPVQITPAMENMKSEMIKSYNANKKGPPVKLPAPTSTPATK